MLLDMVKLLNKVVIFLSHNGKMLYLLFSFSPFSFKECFEALQGMNHNKSPGYDGLTVEFYTFGFDNEMMALS